VRIGQIPLSILVMLYLLRQTYKAQLLVACEASTFCSRSVMLSNEKVLKRRTRAYHNSFR